MYMDDFETDDVDVERRKIDDVFEHRQIPSKEKSNVMGILRKAAKMEDQEEEAKYDRTFTRNDVHSPNNDEIMSEEGNIRKNMKSFEMDHHHDDTRDTPKETKFTVDDGSVNSEDDETYGNPTNVEEINIFLAAIYHGDIKAVQQAIKNGTVSARCKDRHGWTGAHWASSNGFDDILQLLLENIKKLSVKKFVDMKENISGWTSLHVSARFSLIFNLLCDFSILNLFSYDLLLHLVCSWRLCMGT